jgi:hypothetical protein
MLEFLRSGRLPPDTCDRHVQKSVKVLDMRKPSHSRLRLRGALQMVSAMSPHDGALLRDCLLLNQKNRLSKYFFFSITIGLADGIRRIAMLIKAAGAKSVIASGTPLD